MSITTANRASGKARTARAELKHALAEGRTSIKTILIDPPEVAERMEIRQLLLACPGVSRRKMNRLCLRAHILPTRWLSELTKKERMRLALIVQNRSRR